MTREIAKRLPHVELRDTWTWFQSGLNTDGAHHPVTTRRLKQGIFYR
jgi:creatinase